VGTCLVGWLVGWLPWGWKNESLTRNCPMRRKLLWFVNRILTWAARYITIDRNRRSKDYDRQVPPAL
jgi:hypothetical protein